MRSYLRSYFPSKSVPERFAERCLAAILHTYSAHLLWDELFEKGIEDETIVTGMTEAAFPADVFGPDASW